MSNFNGNVSRYKLTKLQISKMDTLDEKDRLDKLKMLELERIEIIERLALTVPPSSIKSKSGKDICMLTGKKMKSIIYLDWDDTLFCTSFLEKLATLQKTDILNVSLTNDQKVYCVLLEKSIIQMITTLLEEYDVYIVTNAKLEWVYQSTSKYISKVFSIFSKIRIVSAYETYYKDLNGTDDDPTEWKYNTMEYILLKNYKNKSISIMSIGDSKYEKIAMMRIKENTRHSKFLTIYFNKISIVETISSPNILGIITQLDSIGSMHANLLDIEDHTIDLASKYKL